MCGPRSCARLRCARVRLCWRCRARGVLICSETAWAGCAWSSAVTCRDASCTGCSERALSPVCCACCAAAARARRCFICATGCTSVSLFESLRQAGCLRPKAGGGCVSAWSVCVAVRGAASLAGSSAVVRAVRVAGGAGGGISWRVLACRGGASRQSRVLGARGASRRGGDGPPFSVTWTFFATGNVSTQLERLGY